MKQRLTKRPNKAPAPRREARLKSGKTVLRRQNNSASDFYARMVSFVQMATKSIRSLPLEELFKLTKTAKGRAFLREELEIMDRLSAQIRVALGINDSPPTSIIQVPAKAAATSTGIDDFKGLIAFYRNSSAFTSLRHATRMNYETHFKFIEDDLGSAPLSALGEDEFQRAYDIWTNGGADRIAITAQTVNMLRLLASFGAKEGIPECARLAYILKKMGGRYRPASPKGDLLTAEQVDLICERAHKRGRHSIALVQALLFETELRQRDILGEWVPQKEEGFSAVLFENEKWVRGIRWRDLNDLILRHSLSFNGKSVEVSLRECPRSHREIVAELDRMGGKPNREAIVVNDKNGLPWSASEFRRWWRKIADECGIPKNLNSTDVPAHRRQEMGAKVSEA